MEAVDNGEEVAVEFLLKNGANPNCKMIGYGKIRANISDSILSTEGWFDAERVAYMTALDIAQERKNDAIAKLLLREGAQKSKDFSTELETFMDAASQGRIETVKTLLKNGLDVNSKHRGYTALMAAAFRGQADVVEFLIKNGADVNITLDDRTALDFAREFAGYRSRVIRALLEGGAQGGKDIP